MIKGKITLPKCLFYAATQIEKDLYTLIEHTANLISLKLRFTKTIQLYNQQIINLPIAIHDVYMKLKYIMYSYDVTVNQLAIELNFEQNIEIPSKIFSIIGKKRIAMQKEKYLKIKAK